MHTNESNLRLWVILAGCLMLASCKETTEVISCFDSKSNARARVEFDFKNNQFVLEGSVLRRSGPTAVAETFVVHEISNAFGAALSGPIIGFERSAGETCKAISIPMVNPQDSEWVKCSEGMSELEWMGKYVAGKAEPQNATSDHKLERLRRVIGKHCRQFDGKLSNIWISVPLKGKKCDRIGLNVNEFAFPSGGFYSPFYRIESLAAGDSIKCSYNLPVIERLEREGILRKRPQ